MAGPHSGQSPFAEGGKESPDHVAELQRGKKAIEERGRKKRREDKRKGEKE